MGCRYFQFGSSVKMLHGGDTDVSDNIHSKDYKETLSRTRDVIKKDCLWSGICCPWN